MKSSRFRSTIMVSVALVTSALALSGCDKTASGQVVAVVNDDEITLQEINAEMAGMNVPADADKKAIQQQVLQQIIERRLLAQSARDDGVDKDPSFLIRQRQVTEALLVQMYANKAGKSISVPDQTGINEYVQKNPYMFANRTLFTLEQIKFPAPADLNLLKPLEKAQSLADVETTLRAQGIKFERAQAKLDSAQVPPQMMQQIAAVAPGEPFVVPGGPVITASVIVSRAPVPNDPAQNAPMATAAIRNEQMSKIIQQRLGEAKKKATIKYQDGFAPPKAAAESTQNAVVKK